MAKLATTEKQILEKLFQMGDGHVLKFSDRTFGEFFKDDMNIDIFDTKYKYASGSKANRLRAFWQLESDDQVAASIGHFLNYIDTQITLGKARAGEFPSELIGRAREIAVRLSGQLSPKRPSAAEAAPIKGSQNSTVDPGALACLCEKLTSLHSMTPQARGFAFEKFLNDIFDLFSLAPRGSFRLVGEQIDGSFQIGQDVYLVEAKWENHKTSQRDLLSFSGKVEGKAQWSRGIFISYAGFTDDGLEAFVRGKSTRIICMDGLDLHGVLSSGLSLAEAINRKMRRAGETNEAFVSVRDLFPANSF